MKYRVLPLGGCPLNVPLSILRSRGLLTSVFQDVGFLRWPTAISSTDSLQLLRFAKSEIDIPEELQPFTYFDPENRPKPGRGHFLDAAEIVLVELCTPLVFNFNGYALNPNHVNNFLIESSKDDDDGIKRMLMQWRYEGVQMQNEAKRADFSAKLLEYYEPKLPAQSLLIRFLKEMYGSYLKAEDMARDLRSIRESFDRPIALILHHYNYMPGARPVSYPPTFLADLKTLIKMLDLPVFDPAPVVKAHGTDVALAKDMRHYALDFFAIIADEYLGFMRGLLGR